MYISPNKHTVQSTCNMELKLNNEKKNQMRQYFCWGQASQIQLRLDVLKFHTPVACQKDLDRPRSEESVSVYYSDKHFVNSCLVLLVCVVALHPSQQFFSNVGTI